MYGVPSPEVLLINVPLQNPEKLGPVTLILHVAARAADLIAPSGQAAFTIQDPDEPNPLPFPLFKPLK